MVSAPDPKTELFPGANPHPVLRVADDGVLIYANAASGPVIDALGLVVDQAVPATWLDQLLTSDGPIDVRVGPRTYELLAVRLPDVGFTNVYGTDVTAQRAITKFPDQNPNPVFRISMDGVLVYVNPAANELIAGLGGTLGAPFPQPWAEDLRLAAGEGQRRSVHVHSAGRHFELLAVDVPEFQFINVYGTDVTAQRQLEVANQQNLELLLNILPEPIADRIRAGEAADRRSLRRRVAALRRYRRVHRDVDHDGSPRSSSGVLNEVFGVFDTLVDASGLEKVKTIGDAYMVVGGMPIWSPDHLERMADLALDIARAIGRHRRGRPARREVPDRHPCGPGRRGRHRHAQKFIYDVWGDTVNLASRMESTGVAGQIQVTGAVEERLRDRYRLESRGLVDIKGKGPMETFFLLERA